MLEEFKKFALRGNVLDLAVGVIIGVAFNSIVQSLVGDIIMPLIGAVTGGLDFSNYFLPLSSKVTAAALADAKKQGAVMAWGSFLTIMLNFIRRLGAVLAHARRQPNDGRRPAQDAAGHQAGAAPHRDPRPPEEPLMAA
jgi:large conductance mechanosensitive channel protein